MISSDTMMIDTISKLKLDLNLPSNDSFMIQFKQLVNRCQQLELIAPEFDYLNIPANGVRSALRVIGNFCQDVNKSLTTKTFTRRRHSFELQIKCHLSICQYLVDMRSHFDDKGHLTCDLNDEIAFCGRLIQDYLSEPDMLAAIFDSGPTWLCLSARMAMEAYMAAVATAYSGSARPLWDRDSRMKHFVHCQHNASIHHPMAIWNVTENVLFTRGIVGFRHLLAPVSVKTILVPKSAAWALVAGKVVKTLADKKSDTSGTAPGSRPKKLENTVRCRFLTHKRHLPRGRLIIHCHGGGFVAHSPDSHEMYLRNWIANLEGVAMLSVDYTLRVDYRQVVLEVLEVYLWTVSGSDEVRRVLGFEPTDVVLVGDSAGGIVLGSLLVVLNEIKQQEQFNLLMPKAFVSIYTPFGIAVKLAPSRVFAGYDPLLSVGAVLALYGKIVVGLDCDGNDNVLELTGESIKSSKKEEIKIAPKIRPRTKRSISRSVKEPSELLWHVCDPVTFNQRLLVIGNYLKEYQLLGYNKIDQLSGINLHLINLHFCASLDDNVTLAKKWRGKVTFDVLDKLPHGFLHFEAVSKECHAAALICQQKIKDSFHFK